MPIYEYICKECQHQFEALVFGKEKAECPKCQAVNSFVAIGPGVERLEEEVRELFTQARLLVLSSDLAATVERLREELDDVAAGRFDGYCEYGLSPWDVAAGILLVREAGGYVSDPENDGDPVASGNILAANDHLHGPLHSMLVQNNALVVDVDAGIGIE